MGKCKFRRLPHEMHLQILDADHRSNYGTLIECHLVPNESVALINLVAQTAFL